jgi:hypothetical protein
MVWELEHLIYSQMKVREISLTFASLSKTWLLDKMSTFTCSAMLAVEDMLVMGPRGRGKKQTL